MRSSTGRTLPPSNVEAALEQISVRDIRGILKKQLSCGQVQYKEEYLIERLFEIAMEKDPEEAPGFSREVREEWQEASRPTGLYPERSEEKSGTQSEQAENSKAK